MVVPAPQPVIQYCQDRGINLPSSLPVTLETICKMPEVNELISLKSDDSSEQGALSHLERVRIIKLLPTPFSVENDLLTVRFCLGFCCFILLFWIFALFPVSRSSFHVASFSSFLEFLFLILASHSIDFFLLFLASSRLLINCVVSKFARHI